MSNQFDFWVGEWDCRWDGGHGSNVVTSELDGAVIFEQFDGRPGVALRGMSVSVYDAGEDLWRQTWVDSERGYIDLVGRFADGAMELTHKDTHRMRFTDIEDDTFVWHWERFEETWNEVWRINYSRR